MIDKNKDKDTDTDTEIKVKESEKLVDSKKNIVRIIIQNQV